MTTPVIHPAYQEAIDREVRSIVEQLMEGFPGAAVIPVEVVEAKGSGGTRLLFTVEEAGAVRPGRYGLVPIGDKP